MDMGAAWTPERRQRQAEQIRNWRPWEQATGPRTADGKARISQNAWKGGQRPELRRLAKRVKAELAAMGQSLPF